MHVLAMQAVTEGGGQIDGSLVVDTLGEHVEKPADRPGKRIGTGWLDTDMSHLPAGREKRLDKGLNCSVQLSGLREGEDNRSPRVVDFGIHGGANFRRLTRIEQHGIGMRAL